MPPCPTCGAPSESKVKWNGGNPKPFDFPTCTCEEEATERRLDEMLARRREHQQ